MFKDSDKIWGSKSVICSRKHDVLPSPKWVGQLWVTNSVPRFLGARSSVFGVMHFFLKWICWPCLPRQGYCV